MAPPRGFKHVDLQIFAAPQGRTTGLQCVEIRAVKVVCVCVGGGTVSDG